MKVTVKKMFFFTMKVTVKTFFFYNKNDCKIFFLTMKVSTCKKNLGRFGGGAQTDPEALGGPRGWGTQRSGALVPGGISLKHFGEQVLLQR